VLLHDMHDRLVAMETRQNQAASFRNSNGSGNGCAEAGRALPPGWITRCTSCTSCVIYVIYRLSMVRGCWRNEWIRWRACVLQQTTALSFGHQGLVEAGCNRSEDGSQT
jgi:hypothetical protein